MADEYQALTFIKLPLPEGGDEGVLKKPGDPISAAELEAAGQDEDDIQRLMDSDALGYPGDPVAPDHRPPDDEPVPDGSDEHAISGDDGGGNA
jgi:hypothetical protein